MAASYEEARAEHDNLAAQVRVANAGQRRALHRRLRASMVELFAFARARGIPPEQARPHGRRNP